MAQNDIFGKIFCYWWIRREIIFNLICHMPHVLKLTKLAFFAFLKTLKMAQNDIFGKILFSCPIRPQNSFNLICHMIHIWISPENHLKKVQNGSKNGKNDFLQIFNSGHKSRMYMLKYVFGII